MTAKNVAQIVPYLCERCKHASDSLQPECMLVKTHELMAKSCQMSMGCSASKKRMIKATRKASGTMNDEMEPYTMSVS